MLHRGAKFLRDARGCGHMTRSLQPPEDPPMSASTALKPVLPPDIRAMQGAAALVVLTAYTTPVARLVDGHCDVVLVGDSGGHGDPRPALDAGRDDGDDDPARPRRGAGRAKGDAGDRHALRQL
jgi:hypothetical protein